MAQIKPWFKIKPKNRKLLKSSKVRKYFSDIELVIAKELTKQMLELTFSNLPPAREWFMLEDRKARDANTKKRAN